MMMTVSHIAGFKQIGEVLVFAPETFRCEACDAMISPMKAQCFACGEVGLFILDTVADRDESEAHESGKPDPPKPVANPDVARAVAEFVTQRRFLHDRIKSDSALALLPLAVVQFAPRVIQRAVRAGRYSMDNNLRLPFCTWAIHHECLEIPYFISLPSAIMAANLEALEDDNDICVVQVLGHTIWKRGADGEGHYVVGDFDGFDGSGLLPDGGENARSRLKQLNTILVEQPEPTCDACLRSFTTDIGVDQCQCLCACGDEHGSCRYTCDYYTQ
jgi:hypothetical protein